MKSSLVHILVMLVVLVIGARTAWSQSQDLGFCQCVSEATYFPNNATGHQGIGLEGWNLGITLTRTPTDTIRIGQWFKVTASFGMDQDLKKGPGVRCFTPAGACSGPNLPECGAVR